MGIIGFIQGFFIGIIGFIQGLYRVYTRLIYLGIIGAIMGLHRNNGKDNGNLGPLKGIYRIYIYRGYIIGIMENKMGTTTV